MDTLIAPPIQASANDRAEARRVSDYLRCFGLTEPVRIEQLTARFVAEAEAKGESAVMCAERAVAAWFAAMLGPKLTKPDLAGPIGRAALLIAGGPERWPGAFLADGSPPADLATALRRAVPVPAPDPVPAAMVAQALEVPTLLPAFLRPLPRVERSSL